MSTPLLHVDRFRVFRQAEATADPLLDLPALTLLPGERVALTGPSGIGKSTLLRGLTRLQPMRADRFELDGLDVLTLGSRELRQRIGYLPQVPVALSDSVLEDCRLTFSFAGPLPADWRAQSEAMLERVGLAATHWTTDPSRLSVGQRMRLALARRLLHDPAMLLLDEPFAPLDPKAREEIMALILAWTSEGARAIVVVLHDLALAAQLASTIWDLVDPATMHVRRLDA